jgi:hypothetical protein
LRFDGILEFLDIPFGCGLTLELDTMYWTLIQAGVLFSPT